MTLASEIRQCANLTNDALWAAMNSLSKGERRELARFLVHLAEVKRRDLHIERAYPGLYHYLRSLGFSEWEARARALATTSAMKYPSIYRLIGSGRLTLSALALVAPFLTPDNHRLLLRKCCRRSTREVQVLVAGLAPKPPRRDVVRVISAPSPVSPEPPAEIRPAAAASEPQAPWDELFGFSGRPSIERRPKGETRMRQTFDCSAELQEKLQRVKYLLSNKYPSMRLEFVLDDALEALLEKIDPERRHARRIDRVRKRTFKAIPATGNA